MLFSGERAGLCEGGRYRDAYNGETTVYGFWNFTSLSRVSPECHMCHKIVTEMSQDCPAVSRDVADVSPDVTEMSRPSHIFVTVCHKLSQQLSHQSRRVTECQYICRHVNKLTYASLRWGVALGCPRPPVGEGMRWGGLLRWHPLSQT